VFALPLSRNLDRRRVHQCFHPYSVVRLHFVDTIWCWLLLRRGFYMRWSASKWSPTTLYMKCSIVIDARDYSLGPNGLEGMEILCWDTMDGKVCLLRDFGFPAGENWGHHCCWWVQNFLNQRDKCCSVGMILDLLKVWYLCRFDMDPQWSILVAS